MNKLLLTSVLGIMVSFLIGKRTAETQARSAHTSPGTPEAMFANYQDFKWKKSLPDLGDSSPEISILQVDPQTQATKLVIRTPKGIHIRKHWHSANETHTAILGNQVFECEGKRIEQGPGSVGSPRFSLGQAVILDELIEASDGREQVRQS